MSFDWKGRTSRCGRMNQHSPYFTRDQSRTDGAEMADSSQQHAFDGNAPLISIVTIVLNDPSGLERTLQSIERLEGELHELIVVDGGSSAPTAGVIRDHAPSITTLISETDKGIADAFNKGIARARGDYVIFMNAGDSFRSPESLCQIRKYLEPIQWNCVIGAIALLDPKSGSIVPAGKVNSGWRQLLRNYWPHQAMLIRRSVFDACGDYSTQFEFGMDYEWSLRYLKTYGTSEILHIPDKIALMETGGKSMRRYPATFFAYHRARTMHFKYLFPASVCFTAFFIIRRAVGTFVRKNFGVISSP